MTIWYECPASEWLEAIPIGNGRLGAMVFGGLDEEVLMLNESTLWSGEPHDYNNPKALAALPEIRRLVFAGQEAEAQALIESDFLGQPVTQASYQPVGDLVLQFANQSAATNYRRELDLETAIAHAAYDLDGVRYHRETFASAPHQVIALRLTADQPGKLSFTATLRSLQETVVTVQGTETLVLTGTVRDDGAHPGAVRFCALARIVCEGGQIQVENGRVTVSDADAVTILTSVATSYRRYDDIDGDPIAIAREFLDTATGVTHAELREAHIADYQRLFQRVTIDLGESSLSARPTDERIRTFQFDQDPALVALYAQFGRYLLISSSRPGGQPANLQGLWNESLTPPWGSKYTININTEMNYWPAGPVALLECCDPIFALLTDLVETGTRIAQQHYDARGWVAHHNTDAWRGTAPVDSAIYGMWPSGGAWLCKTIWDTYEFGGDSEALEIRYPIIKGAALFFLDTLMEAPGGQGLVTNPSISPENEHHLGVTICAGPMMDRQILADLFDSCIRISEMLGMDEELFRGEVMAARARLAPMQIGSDGQLQEWLEDWDASATDPQHRHVSHLYGLFPSNQITPEETPELFEAARTSLLTRGDEATGWSIAWKINLWARLRDGDHAHKLLTDLLTPERTAPNLFDLHPPFQIDGNFGACCAIFEMLLQSQNGVLHLLPALPSAWPSGSVTGICARGGYRVDLAWADGVLTNVVIRSSRAGTVSVRYQDHVQEIEMFVLGKVRLSGELFL